MTRKSLAIGILALLVSTPAAGQLGSLGKAIGKAAEVRDELTFNEAEEQQIGGEISAKLRDRYGVVQDRVAHKYVTLLGRSLAAASSRPNLKWTFIVLDTDGVNAFAAPGGFVHITRGALGVIRDEAELAGVLGHEIAHVTAKHTLEAIRKSKMVGVGAQASRSAVLSQAADRGYEILLENNFDRKDEMESDKVGITLGNSVGYAPAGLGDFLTRLSDRNKSLKDRSGMFASHPETKARLDNLVKIAVAGKLAAVARGSVRYKSSITFPPTPVASVADAAAPASKPASGGLGLGNMASLGREKSSDQTVSSAGSRGVNPDRDAKGGPVKTLVGVTVTTAEADDFRKGIA